MDRSVVSKLYLSVKAQPGYIQLEQSDARVQRTGSTEVCVTNYGSKKTSNCFEVLVFPVRKSILLGMDILPYLGILIAGMINPLIPTDAKWEPLLTPHEEDLEHDQVGFRVSLWYLLDQNGQIPPDVHCNLPGSVVDIPNQKVKAKNIRHAKV
ncbi:hypothetical protein SARC_09019 [Sphaeroforma arctica JP610]|uniref:Uncharacterized protein n=1 Tax=Sphaeroforma arctica JP610 TaxID=667725 RepID=A0A0L0FRD8_9EUKA|nr:hypothetical protein SARC_09019 [Sphaeroforma arctica JP610]KNC78558.1 hypothetical protein SARC_09019 [Sphaeroforma arctica JP610]|eukprot:XP_014152460.1 hypothetical protein SARC_09019 [Sphaeroforma arctica JP610]